MAKSLTRDQSYEINNMNIFDDQRKIVRKVVRFVNNKNQYFKKNHDTPNTAFVVSFCTYIMRIYRKDNADISIDLYFYATQKDPILEISLSSKPDGATISIMDELFRLIYGN